MTDKTILSNADKRLEARAPEAEIRHAASITTAPAQSDATPTPSLYGRPLRVAVGGFGTHQLKTLKFFFEATCNGRYEVADNPFLADLFLVDLDEPGGPATWEMAQDRHAHRPAILLAQQTPQVSRGHVLGLPKPFRSEELQQVLSEIEAWLPPPLFGSGSASAPAVNYSAGPATVDQRTASARPSPALRPTSPHRDALRLGAKQSYADIGTAADIDPADPAQLQRAQYDPDRYLIGVVRKAVDSARAQGRPAHVTNRRCDVILLPEISVALLETDERHLHNLAAMPLVADDFPIRLLEAHWLPAEEPKHRLHLDSLLWDLTLRASRGRMPEGTDPHAPVHLRRWPDLPRLRLPPHTVRIAALWMHQPRSLIETSRVLDIAQRYVFAVYSAANVLGLAYTEGQGEPTQSPAEQGPPSPSLHPKRGLLSRLLRHLRPRAE